MSYIVSSFIRSVKHLRIVPGIQKNDLKTSYLFSRLFSSHTPHSNVKVFQDVNTALKENELPITKSIIGKVNEHINCGNEGRLFAVVHISGKQFKITSEDIIIVEGYWPPCNGDEIRLEKVLLVGGSNFSLIGRPILPQNLVTVKATIIEKDLSHAKALFFKKRRKQYQRLNFFRAQLTMLRINEIYVSGNVNDHQTTSQYERV